jgi:hypothetical protein
MEESVGEVGASGAQFAAADAALASIFINRSAYLKLYTGYCTLRCGVWCCVLTCDRC